MWNGCLIKSPRLKHRSSRLSWRLTGLETEREREREKARLSCPLALPCPRPWQRLGRCTSTHRGYWWRRRRARRPRDTLTLSNAAKFCHTTHTFPDEWVQDAYVNESVHTREETFWQDWLGLFSPIELLSVALAECIHKSLHNTLSLTAFKRVWYFSSQKNILSHIWSIPCEHDIHFQLLMCLWRPKK